MRKILITLGLILITLVCLSQRTYISEIKGINNIDSAKHCIEIFNQLDYLGIYNVEYLSPSRTFIIKSKKYLNPTIIEDYFIGSGYEMTTFFEQGITHQMIILPNEKDTTKPKPLKIFSK